MSDQPKVQPNFEKIETVTSGYFSYIIGHFHQPDLYVLGAMDLNDPASWSGGETSVVFYFMITPEEYSWLKEDRAKLDALAQKIQTNMPKSRFFSATSKKKGSTPEELKAICDQSLKADALEEDEAFDAWKKTLRFPRRIVVPKTPFNEARHALALCQQHFDLRTATQKQKDEELDLEKKLGWQIFKAEALYVAYDQCFNPRFPMVEAARGDVHLYSTQELADNSAKFYQEHNYYFTTIKKLEQKDIKPFLRTCEELGIQRFRVDDGLEPVTIWLTSIIPSLDRGFIENYNTHIRGLMLRTMQILRLLQLHGDDMEPQRKAGLNDWFMTWNRMMLQDLGKTTLFVPCGMPAQLTDQLKNDYAYSPAGMKTMQELMKAQHQEGKALARASFTGRHAVLNSPEGAKYPIRMLKTPDEKQWLMAFTSREAANDFVAHSKNADLVVAMSLDELAAQASICNGVLVDATTIALSLNEKALEQAMKVRSEKRVVFRSQAAGAAPQAEENAEAAAPEEAAQSADVDVSVPLGEDGPQEIQQTEVDGTQEKVSFFSKLFGKK